ncbi:hypothetical protein PAV_4c01020 [Paenibacillus alvei DSM 29]|uniref:hypothetical protein n=1 Tax=Paenibacillus alvei TaxID=44250 RepID=UPI0002895BE2|nr:hypothetical protein [Paenibacillus alvei]EJW17021.1 hypothetical protein PAV_4c01020 [Paenibacillus alvei DSM 29]
MAQANDRRWTWMLMRGPNRPVIQYSVPTVVVRLVMFIVIGGVGALFLSLVIQRFAMHDIVVRHAQLEQELQKKDQLLADMDKQLTIITASSNDMKQRMDKISQWEQQLQSYLQIPTGTGRQKITIQYPKQVIQRLTLQPPSKKLPPFLLCRSAASISCFQQRSCLHCYPLPQRARALFHLPLL